MKYAIGFVIVLIVGMVLLNDKYEIVDKSSREERLVSSILIQARETAIRDLCIDNLTKCNGAKLQWALDEKKKNTGTPITMDDLVPVNPEDRYLTRAPECPKGGTYKLNPTGTLPTCSIGGDHVLKDTFSRRVYNQ